MEINLPDVVMEVRELFERYEAALLQRDEDAITAFFWPSEHAVRYGLAEHSYGFAQIREDRARAAPVHPERELYRTVITTFGRDAASVCAEFGAPLEPRIGRQTQTWMRLPTGWRIVAAHVSTIDPRTLVR
jgi:hypothetical protein